MSSNVISYPAKAAIPASISSNRDSGSARSSCASTAGRSARHLAPRVLRFGASTTFWKESRSFSVVSVSTLSSSARISWNCERSGPPTTHPERQGSRCLRSASTRMRRPASASKRTKDISCSSAWSRGGRSRSASDEPKGQSARWTEEPISPRWMTSGMNGATGAIRRHTISSTSCSVCWQALLSVLSASSHRRLRERRTYQLERSLTTKLSSPRPALWKSQDSKCSWYASAISLAFDSTHRSSGLRSDMAT